MYRVGEKVRTPSGRAIPKGGGVGYVADVRSFQDEAGGLSDDEFALFVSELRSVYGDGYASEHQRVLVHVGGVLEWFMKKDLVLIEGRGG